MFLTENNDNKPREMLYWTCELKSMCSKPKCLWICMGTDLEIGHSVFLKVLQKGKQNLIVYVCENYVLYSGILGQRGRANALSKANSIWFVVCNPAILGNWQEKNISAKGKIM